MEQLRNWDELDFEAGVSFCGGEEEFLLEILADYAEDDKRDEMNRLYSMEDWKEYEVVVHGLKSVSQTVGLIKMSEEAKKLEYACKENRIDYIKENHAGVVEKYAGILNKLREIL